MQGAYAGSAQTPRVHRLFGPALKPGVPHGLSAERLAGTESAVVSAVQVTYLDILGLRPRRSIDLACGRGGGSKA